MTDLDTAPLNNVMDMNVDTAQEAIEKLTMLAEPINGPNSFNLESAAYGYITRDERLVIPELLKPQISETVVEELNLNIIQLLSIAMYNYLRLKKRNMSDDHAYFIAFYRARLVKLGYLLREKSQRCVVVDEVDYLSSAKDHHTELMGKSKEYQAEFEATDKDADPNSAKIAAHYRNSTDRSFKKFIALASTKVEITKFVTMAANQLTASAYLVFRQMGHHYTPELEAKYNVLWKATTLEKPSFLPSNSDLYRVAIHSFGMYSLHEKFYLNKEKNRLAETFLDRSDVTPCGVAVVATCWASISLMQSMPMWNAVYQAYRTQIDSLRKENEKLKDAKEAIKYHKNARLFGQIRGYLDTESAYALAPIAKGFIESMPDTADIKKQKSLDKRAGQNPIAVQMISQVIFNIMDKIAASGAIENALPSAPVARVQEISGT